MLRHLQGLSDVVADDGVRFAFIQKNLFPENDPWTLTRSLSRFAFCLVGTILLDSCTSVRARSWNRNVSDTIHVVHTLEGIYRRFLRSVCRKTTLKWFCSCVHLYLVSHQHLNCCGSIVVRRWYEVHLISIR